ncbi:hypothetical protein [Paenibacillus sp. FSL R10-2748]|jgi:hypothetical protein
MEQRLCCPFKFLTQLAAGLLQLVYIFAKARSEAGTDHLSNFSDITISFTVVTPFMVVL